MDGSTDILLPLAKFMEGNALGIIDLLKLQYIHVECQNVEYELIICLLLFWLVPLIEDK